MLQYEAGCRYGKWLRRRFFLQRQLRDFLVTMRSIGGSRRYSTETGVLTAMTSAARAAPTHTTHRPLSKTRGEIRTRNETLTRLYLDIVYYSHDVLLLPSLLYSTMTITKIYTSIETSCSASLAGFSGGAL